MSLINKEGLVERIENYIVNCPIYSEKIKSFVKEILEAEIKHFPNIDPIKHGKWEKCGYKWECSVCKARINIDGTPKENNLWFCSNCGAKMDGGKE